MAMLPKLKLKALVSFPSNVYGGTGIEVTKANGNYTVDLDYSEFAFFADLPPNSNVLVWDPINDAYTLVPPSATGGISDAPVDGLTYGRRDGAWVDAWASPALTGTPTAPTPTPGDNDTSIATTEFVGTAIAAIPVGGSGDVTGPASAVPDRIAVYNGATGKIIKDGGQTIAEVIAASGGGGGGASVTTSDTPPVGAADGDLWLETDTGLMYAYWDDGSSSQWVAVPAGGSNAPQYAKKNYIINGAMQFNQGSYVSGAVLAAGAYGHDQWKAGAAGGDYSFTQTKSITILTIASGKSLIQPIEDVMVVGGGNYVLAWTGTAQGRAGVNTLTPAGTYAASPLLITGQTDGTVMSVEFNTGTLSGVSLTKGTVAPPFVVPDYAEELRACQRYFQWAGTTGLAGAAEASTFVGVTGVFIVQMRVAPTLSVRPGISISFRTSAGVDTNAASPTLLNAAATTVGFWTQISGFTGLTAGQSVFSRSNSGTPFHASARL